MPLYHLEEKLARILSDDKFGHCYGRQYGSGMQELDTGTTLL